MKKDHRMTLRINREVKDLLQAAGYSLQAIFDEAIAKVAVMKERVIIKEKKGEKE